MLLSPRIKQYAQHMERRSREGRKQVIATEGVFLRNMSPRELMEGATRNLNQLNGAALNPGGLTEDDAADLVNAGADTGVYVAALLARLAPEQMNPDD